MDDSIVELLRRWQDSDDQDAATEVFDRYFHRLVPLVLTRLLPTVQPRVAPEDVATSACRTFFRQVKERQVDLNRLPDAGAVWALLVTIALRKAYRTNRDHTAQRRSVFREVRSLDESDSSAGGGLAVPPTQAASLEADAVLVEDELNWLLGEFENERHRQIVRLTLAGRTPDEIAPEVGRTTRTVNKVLEAVRDLLRDRHARLENGPTTA
jgi:hypothetical protein